MDWVRAAYYQFMVTTGLGDTYRNEQFLPRFDIFYNFERNMLALNFANPDKATVARNLIVHLNFNLKALISVVTGENLI
jgi:hypothetical protein